MNSYNKYIKYKYKYTQIKSQYGGSNDIIIKKYVIDIVQNNKILEIVKTYLQSINDNNTKIGYTNINNIYMHYSIEEFIELLNNNEFNYNVPAEKYFIYIIINFDKIQSKLMNITECNDLITHVPLILQDIIFCKIGIALFCINKILDQIHSNPYFSRNEYKELIIISINHDYNNLSLITTEIKNYLGNKIYLQIPIIALNKDFKALEFFIFDDEYTDEYHDIILSLVKDNGYALQYVVEKLLVPSRYLHIVKAAIKQNSMSLKYAYKGSNPAFIILFDAVRQNGMALQYVNADVDNYYSIVKNAVQQNGLALQYAGSLQNDIDIVKTAVQQNGLALQYASSLQNDIDIVKTAVQQNGLALQYASSLQNDIDIVEKAVQQNGLALQYASEDILQSNINIVIDVLNKNGMVLEFLTDKFKIANPDIVEKAVQQNGLALQYASEDILQNNINIVTDALNKNGMVLKVLPDIFKNDRYIVKIAIEQNGMVLRFVVDKFKNDLFFIKTAVMQNSMVFRFINDEYKKNKHIIKAAINQNYMILEFIDYELINNILVLCTEPSDDSVILNIFKYYPSDINLYKHLPDIFKTKNFTIQVIEKNGMFLKILSDNFKNDIDIVKRAVIQNGLALEFLPGILNNHPDIIEIIKSAVIQNGLALKFLHDTLEDRPGIIEIIKLAVRQNGLALEFVPFKYKNNLDIITIAVEQNGMALTFSNKTFQLFLEKYSNINKKAIKQNGMVLEIINENFKIDDVEIIIKAITQNGMMLEFVPDNLKMNPYIVKLAIIQNPMALKFVYYETLYEILTDCTESDESLVLNIFEYLTNIEELYKNLPSIFKNNKDFIIKIIKQNVKYYIYCSDNIKNLEEVIIEVLKIDITYYVLIPKIQQNNEIIINYIIKQNKQNNYISDNLYINILHIGYLELNNTHSNVYIKYKFIKVDITSDITAIILKIKRFKTYANTDKNNKYYILITLDALSYLQYNNTIETNTDDTIVLPDILYDDIRYKNEISPFTSNRVVTVNDEYKNKIASLYIEIENELIVKGNYNNIYIINIANTNNLKNSNYYNRIINILINKYNSKDIKCIGNYIEDNYRYKYVELSLDAIYDNRLLSHWLNNLFITPNILKGRQQQISSTCTTNSIFNSLFLVDDIKNVLIRKYNTFKETNSSLQGDIDYTDLRLSTIPIDRSIILYSIIGNIIKNIKHTDNNINYMIILAAYMKNIRHTRMGVYKYIGDGIKELLSIDDFNKFEENYFFKICRASVDNSYRTKLCSDPITHSDRINALTTACKYNESICIDSNDYDKINGYIHGDGADYTMVMEFFKLIFSTSDENITTCMTNLINKSRSEIIIDDNDISILFICNTPDMNKTEPSNLNEIEVRNNNKYLLQSCQLTNDAHAICGIKNYKKESSKDFDYYIYDSNNIYSNDDWSQLLITSTKSMILEELEVKKKKFYKMPFLKKESYSARFFIYTYKKSDIT